MKFNRKRGNKRPEVSTVSLPDIIFMLLFFFMVVTVMRKDNLLVEVRPPQASEIEKLEKKSLISYIYIGQPISANYREVYGKECLQLNDQIATKEDIIPFMANEEILIAEADKGKMITSLRIDKTVGMGLVADVKTEIRKSGKLKINYSTISK